MKKEKIFLILSIFLVFISYLAIDYSLSKILFKNNHCYNFKYFSKGYFYDLKKIVNQNLDLKVVFQVLI